MDHVSVDLARLLGSLVGDDEDRWHMGLAAYRAIRPLTLGEEAQARTLDRSGVLVSLANWLLWLYRDGRAFDNLTAVARRLSQVVARVEAWR